MVNHNLSHVQNLLKFLIQHLLHLMISRTPNTHQQVFMIFYVSITWHVFSWVLTSNSLSIAEWRGESPALLTSRTSAPWSRRILAVEYLLFDIAWCKGVIPLSFCWLSMRFRNCCTGKKVDQVGRSNLMPCHPCLHSSLIFKTFSRKSTAVGQSLNS